MLETAQRPRTLQEALERIEELEGLLGRTDQLPLLGLSRSEWGILQMLLARPLATKEALFTLLYGGLSEVDPKIIDVFVCKIRRKLRPLGVQIETIWGRGYFLPAEEKLKVRKALEKENGAKDAHSVAA